MRVFDDIYKTNFWASDESVSGKGSELSATEKIRDELPGLFEQYSIRSFIDIPCGDFNWMGTLLPRLPGIGYIGADVVSHLIVDNQWRYPDLDFRVLDISKDKLPRVDLIFVRDLLGHFSNVDVKHALKNIRASGATYLLATTFPGHENLHDITTGQWRPINLASFFGLPDPIETINEGLTGEFGDKSLGLWRL
jgi:hypothetical protein